MEQKVYRVYRTLDNGVRVKAYESSSEGQALLYMRASFTEGSCMELVEASISESLIKMMGTNGHVEKTCTCDNCNKAIKFGEKVWVDRVIVPTVEENGLKIDTKQFCSEECCDQFVEAFRDKVVYGTNDIEYAYRIEWDKHWVEG